MTVFNTDNKKKCFLKIRMISERSCDTKDWSMMLKIQRCHHSNK